MTGRLKPLDVERETRPDKYADGDGLYLIVASATSNNVSILERRQGALARLGGVDTYRIHKTMAARVTTAR
jgi:hypothetical protein